MFSFKEQALPGNVFENAGANKRSECEGGQYRPRIQRKVQTTQAFSFLL
jgi:hypothetical protein